MKYAWVENSKIRDVCHGIPSECYTPNIAELYSAQVPDDAENGDGWDGTTLTKPVIPAPVPIEPVAPVPPKVSPIQFKLLFTPQERIAISAAKATDPVLQDIYSILDDPRLTEVDLALSSTQQSLGYLVTQSLLTSERVAQILTGTPV